MITIIPILHRKNALQYWKCGVIVTLQRRLQQKIRFQINEWMNFFRNNCFLLKISCSFTWKDQKNSMTKGNALKSAFYAMGQKWDKCGGIETLQNKNVFSSLSHPIFIKFFMVTLYWMDRSMVGKNTHHTQFQVDFFIIF